MATPLWQIITNAPSATTLTLQNGASGTSATGYDVLLDGLDVGDAVWNQVFSGWRGTQGARPAYATPENRPLSMHVMVLGTSKDDTASKSSTLHNAVEELRKFGGRVKFQSSSATYPVYFDVMTAQLSLQPWGFMAENKNRPIYQFAAICAPYLKGDPMDISDTFSSDTLSNYTFDAGASSNVVVTGGVLDAAANFSTENRAIHTALGYSYGDTQATVKATPGATITSFKAGVILKRVDASNYLEVYVDDNGTNSRLRFDKVVAGSRTNLATTNLGSRVSNGTAFWVRGRIERNVVYREFFSSTPTPMGTPDNAPASTTLSSSEASTFGESITGKAGFVFTPQDTAAALDDFTVEPYTYRNVSTPDRVPMYGSIPGDSPALVDLTVTPSGGSNAPVFALAGWASRPAPWNWVVNSSFETDTSLWAGSNATVLVGTSTISRVTTAAKYGSASLQVVTPGGAALNGAAHIVYRRFKKGVTYTFRLWQRSAAASTTMQLALYDPAGSDVGSATNTALSTTWTQMSGTWTPTADYDYAILVHRTTTNAAITYTLDGVEVFEGTTAPTVTTQIEGASGQAPFGIIEAETATNLSNWAIAASSAYRGANTLTWTTSGAGTSRADFAIDPSLLVPDDYTQGDIQVEVWARGLLNSTNVSPKLIASVLPSAGTSFGSQRYTSEYGSAGKALTIPSSSFAYRTWRIGTLQMYVDRTRPLIWTLRIEGSTATGSSGTFNLDYLILVPASSRAVSPTGKANDSTYPKFVSSTSQTSKTIRSDLSGWVSSPPANPHPDHGLGGSLLEIPTGDVDWVVKMSMGVPDDTTSDTTSEVNDLNHAATIHLGVTPRYRLLRAS